MHCASLLRTIFARKLARARTQRKKFLDSELNVCFLLNEHGDLYFLLHNNSVHIVLLNLKENEKVLSEGKKDIGERVHETVTL